MANVRSGNSFYVDSLGEISTLGGKAFYIVVTPTGGSPTIELSDTSSGNLKLRLDVSPGDGSKMFDFSLNPLYFGGGIEITAISHCVATIVYNERGG